MKTRLLISIALVTMCLNAGAQTTEYDIDRGFIHPGGLHTQADFDRVKAQLAAGNTKVKQAYNVLKASEYSQSSVQTYPVETIVRGGGSGENYMNAARGAAAAYQNALRWKIDGTVANAKAAVRILMAWANTTKAIGGDSNYALAAGLYGYQFAQAAELMRDYEGWSQEEFMQYQKWMLTVWYPSAIGFLRVRNGTWENADKWWQAPGHYWSNWGLCNALCVISIGILCDDVFIYNQGMSYFKYDQCATYRDPRTEVPIKNDGLTEFLGNLVVTTYESELETGAYGKLGQLNESGRDAGHSSMSLGLALDIAKMGWNQGDDLFAYMEHRLAAGIEYLAAQSLSIEGLPWVNYIYGTNGYYYTDSRCWTMTGPAMGAQMRPYWGTVIGIYEGVKGVTMPFAEQAYANMGIDGGGAGSTSGGYDHLGFSVLMNTRDVQLCPADQVATELTPKMEYSSTLTTNLIPSLSQEKTRKLVEGKTLCHNELGGLVNSYTTNTKTCLPKGQTLRLMPQLPEGEEDTGLWKWETGETTREITITTDKSRIYRVTYTNKNGVESQLCFSIAVEGDCRADRLTPTITIGTDEGQETTAARLLYGKTAKLKVTPSSGWGTYKWTGSKTTQEITVSALKKSSNYTVDYTNQGAAISSLTFHLDVLAAQPFAYIATKQANLIEEEATEVNGKFLALHTSLAVDATSEVKLGLTLPTAVKAANVTWDNGATGDTLRLSGISESRTYTARFTLSNEEVEMRFTLYVRPTETSAIAPGQYLLRHIGTNTYLTANGKGELVTFNPRNEADGSQTWQLEQNESGKYAFISLATTDSLRLYSTVKTTTVAAFPFYIDQAIGTDRLALRTGTNSSRKYWDVDDEGSVNNAAATLLLTFPFQLLRLDGTGIESIKNEKLRMKNDETLYDLNGRKISNATFSRGIYIIGDKKILR